MAVLCKLTEILPVDDHCGDGDGQVDGWSEEAVQMFAALVNG